MADQIRPFLGRDRAAGVVHATPGQFLHHAEGDQEVKKAKPISDKDAQRAILFQLVNELQRLNDTNSQAAARNSSGALNNVLESATFVFDSTATLSRNYRVQAGSALIINVGATPVTFAPGSQAGGSAPTSGVGVMVVAAGTRLAVPVGSHSVTLWGTAAASVCVQVFTGLQAFGVSA